MVPKALRVALDAHVVGRQKTGNETYVVNLANALAVHPDVDPVVFVDKGIRWPGETDIEVRYLHARTPLLRIPFDLPVRAHRAAAELLHVQYVAPPVSHVPVVTAIHDLSFEDLPGFFPRHLELRLRILARLAARRSRAVVTISSFTRSRILKHFEVDPDRVFVTPLAVSPRWVPLPREEQKRRLAHLHLAPIFVLAVGDIHPRKNVVRLVQSLAMTRAGGLGDVHLVIAGQRGWHADEVDQAIDDVGGAGWVHSLGYVDDEVLQALYGAAQVVAYPSLYEGFGLPALEALACGAVLVAANSSAVPEVVGDAAILVDPTNVADIANGIARAISDGSVRARLSAAGPNQASQFTWARCAEATVTAYRAALNRTGGLA